MGHHQSTQNDDEISQLPLNWPVKSPKGTDPSNSDKHLNLAIIALVLVLASALLYYLLRKIFRKIAGAQTITFAFHHETKDGEEVAICGNAPELGQWDPNRAPTMKLTKDQNDDIVWVKEIELNFSPEEPLEYKYVLLTREGWNKQFKEWEPCANRVLREKNAHDGGALVLHQCWGGRDKDCKEPIWASKPGDPVDCLTQPLIASQTLIGG